MIRQRIIDGLNLRIRQQFFIRAVRMRNGKLFRRFFRRVQFSGRNRVNVAESPDLHARNHLLPRNFRRAENAPFHFVHHVENLLEIKENTRSDTLESLTAMLPAKIT